MGKEEGKIKQETGTSLWTSPTTPADESATFESIEKLRTHVNELKKMVEGSKKDKAPYESASNQEVLRLTIR